jgi:hypothetical protein
VATEAGVVHENTCSELRISVVLLGNISHFQLALIENIALTLLTLSENQLTVINWLFRYLLSASIHEPFRLVPRESALYSRG